MFVLKLIHVFTILFTDLMIYNGSHGQRRIQEGEVVPDTVDRKYVVYLLKADVSPRGYVGWLCGGALVDTQHIVTSAACVTDVIHLYAIAGYKKYIKNKDEMMKDPCIQQNRKKIIYRCTPKDYELEYENLEKWSYNDIAVVRVESPYKLEEEIVPTGCSYAPQAIEVNYEKKYQLSGVDAIVFGWGHKEKYRMEDDDEDGNEEVMNYAPVVIQNKDDCKESYKEYDGMAAVIDKYMICTSDKGNINAEGRQIVVSKPTMQGCNADTKTLKGNEGISCEELAKPEEEALLFENSRKHTKGSNQTRDKSNQTQDYSVNDDIHRNVVDSNMTTYNHSLINKTFKNVNSFQNRQFQTRRSGICQNDHGGPLVTWVGSHEVLIGVASVFKVTADRKCSGSYLFTSTQCNGAFLDCILTNDDSKTPTMRRAICESPPEIKGFEIIEQHISWKDHPDGPAENERNGTYPQQPTNSMKFESTLKNKTDTINDTIKEKYTENFVDTTIIDLSISSIVKNLLHYTTISYLNTNEKTSNISFTTSLPKPTSTNQTEHRNTISKTSKNKIENTHTNTMSKTNVVNIVNATSDGQSSTATSSTKIK